MMQVFSEILSMTPWIVGEHPILFSWYKLPLLALFYSTEISIVAFMNKLQNSYSAYKKF